MYILDVFFKTHFQQMLCFLSKYKNTMFKYKLDNINETTNNPIAPLVMHVTLQDI